MKTEWIDIKDKLPGEKMIVLCCIVVPFSMSGLPDYCVRGYYKDEKWYDENNNEIGKKYIMDRSYVSAWRKVEQNK